MSRLGDTNHAEERLGRWGKGGMDLFSLSNVESASTRYTSAGTVESKKRHIGSLEWDGWALIR